MSPDARPSQDSVLNFAAFAQVDTYREVNQKLLKIAFQYLPDQFLHVDVATGTGLIPQLVADLCERSAKRATIFGIDPDSFALQIARQLNPDTKVCQFEFIEGVGQETDLLMEGKIPKNGADLVSIHDAIHEIPTLEAKQTTFTAMVRILRADGILTFNSAFTTVAMRELPLEWGRWKSTAFGILGGRRNKEIEAITIHTPEQYVNMIREAGAKPIHEAEIRIELSKEALQAIACYPAFIAGVFRDMIGQETFTLQQKSEALCESLDSRNIASLPRVWHEIIAQKPQA